MIIHWFRTRRRTLAIVGGVLAVLFTIAQLVRPQISNPPVVAEIAAPQAVRQILRGACYDCHSNETELAWFDHLVPAIWIVADDVRRGGALNFSELGDLPAAKQRGVLFEAVNQIERQAMPPAGYRLLHPARAVTPDELATLKDYLISAAPQPIAGEAERAATCQQRQEWRNSGFSTSATIEPAPGGLPFFTDYKSWKTISTTDRWDNQTVRVVLGNDVAQAAIRAGNVDSWPNGTAFAKLAWAQDADGMGNVQAGEFLQIEFMVKDAQKYADTNGWGWGRWLGEQLKPYGDSPEFVGECVRCHAPMKDRDYVFTIPLEAKR